eukprot:CAMPEP_0184696068 /NCGR_PEP_ID=MMETSP0313-20130426/3488_1 /TAXON_ID=2792 /ORGANISM="Porphyridium aerugineum, Strain SAG 1380-2" /LENGTH=46 /DNA_ID= /DNA_START= /DNA_END= /DNA_ORIENTATION=
MSSASPIGLEEEEDVALLLFPGSLELLATGVVIDAAAMAARDSLGA